MRTEVREFLLSVDEKNQWESPKGFLRHLKMKELEQIKMELEQLTGTYLSMDWHVQDASFLTDIRLPKDKKSAECIIDYHFAFRFSNFGNLFTLFGESAQAEDQYQLKSAVSLLESKGYRFIAAEELETKYDGVNTVAHTHFTWWTRFFDYL
jgi:hypothetical protein